VAEYEAIMLGLRKLKAMGVKRAILLSDSQVISDHIDKSLKAKEETLQKYLQTIRRMESHFEGFSVKKLQGHKMTKLIH
jgi:ribonuclease HI